MKILIAVSFLCTLLSIASEAIEDHQPQEATAPLTERLNIAEITHALLVQEMGNDGFLAFVQTVQARFQEWSKEFDNGSIKQYLDDRLLILAPSVTSGKGSAVRDFCKWIALYKVFDEPLPRYIASISDEDVVWIREVLSDFNWDHAALKIRQNASH